MTNYEVFKAATPEKLAGLLTNLAAGILGEHDPRELRSIYLTMLEMLGQEATP